MIAAANPDVMENYIDEHDMVILGNRYESQLCAIEMQAGCIVVCPGGSCIQNHSAACQGQETVRLL